MFNSIQFIVLAKCNDRVYWSDQFPKKEKKLKFAPYEPLLYTGGDVFFDFPIAKEFKKYASIHWYPMVFSTETYCWNSDFELLDLDFIIPHPIENKPILYFNLAELSKKAYSAI